MTRRLISPAGFLLALGCFVFPFLAVSCEPPDRRQAVTAEYTGLDFLFGGRPDLTGPGAGRSAGIYEDRELAEFMFADPQPAAILALLVVIGSVASAFVLGPRLRSVAMIAGGATAALLLVVNQITVHNRAADRLTEPGSKLAQLKVFDVSAPRFGFWLALAFLLAVTGYNAYAYTRGRRGDDAHAAPSAVPAFPPEAYPGPELPDQGGQYR
jgi:hypothetical protein